MFDLFECLAEVTSEATLLHTNGELDLSNIGRLRSAVIDAFAQGRPVIVDLAGMKYIDGSGFRAFEDLHRTNELQQRVLVLARPSPFMMKLMKLIQLDRTIPVFDSISSAREWCRSHTG